MALAEEAIHPLVQVNAQYYRALHYYEQKNWRSARDAFQDFLNISDRNLLFIPAMYYLAYCYQQLNEEVKSTTLYQKVIAQASEDDAFWGQMAKRRLQEISPDFNTLN